MWGWGPWGMPPPMMMMMMKGKGGKGKGKSSKGEGKNQVMAKLAMGEQIYNGTVKSYIADKKCGFIVSDDITWTCGQDVYAYEDVLQRANAGAGDSVAFFVHWSARGQPQASSPMLRIAKQEGDFALKGTVKGPGKEGAEHAFIDCAETKEFFGRDVYVNKDLAPTAAPGDTVRFNVYLNRDGMPNAAQMEVCEAAWEPVASDLSETVQLQIGKGKKGKGKGKGKGSDGPGKGTGKGAALAQPLAVGALTNGAAQSAFAPF